MHDHRGFALLWVLWSAVLLGLLALVVLTTGRDDARLASIHRDRALATAVADGALEAVVASMLSRPPDTFGLRTDGTIYGWRDEDHSVFVRVTAEVGRIDLNGAQKSLLASLARASGLPADTAVEVADEIVSFRSSSEELRPGSVTDKIFEPKHRPFQAVSELLGVSGVTRPIHDRLAQSLTVMTGQSIPTAVVAPPIVRAALEGGGPPPELQTGVESKSLGSAPMILVNGTGARGRNSAVFRVETGAVRGSTVFGEEVLVRLLPGNVRPFRVLSRRQTSWIDRLVNGQ